jgi:dTDP-4-dehydrorhamnose reductase
MRRVLILGGSGLVGTAILNEMNRYEEFELYATYFENPVGPKTAAAFQLDSSDPSGIGAVLDAVRPQIVISCLRGDFGKQLLLHVKAAEYLKETGGILYFFSTANVFDCDFSRPHYEDDAPDSQTDYGQYKIACENKMTEILRGHVCILRIPQVWGRDSPRMKELLNMLHGNGEITVYPRLFHNTITDVMIAGKLCYIIRRHLTGIFHLAPDDIVNYRDFYQELIAGLGFSTTGIVENFEEKGCFALLSKRDHEFPEELRVTNQSVIDDLVGKRTTNSAQK